MFARGGVEIDLNGSDARDGLQSGDFGRERIAEGGRIRNAGGEIGSAQRGCLKMGSRLRFDANDGNERRTCGDTQRLEAGPDGEWGSGPCARRGMLRAEVDSFGEESDGGLIRLEKAKVLGAFPSPEGDGWKILRAAGYGR